jgi:hypothetical protein
MARQKIFEKILQKGDATDECHFSGYPVDSLVCRVPGVLPQTVKIPI